MRQVFIYVYIYIVKQKQNKKRTNTVIVFDYCVKYASVLTNHYDRAHGFIIRYFINVVLKCFRLRAAKTLTR